MRISDLGIYYIKGFEGFSAKAYPDPGTGAKPYTIGYGTTIYPNGIKVRMDDTCTEDEAEEYLRNDVTKFEKKVTELLEVPVSQNQFDALVSLVYNIGATNFTNSTLLRELNRGSYEAAAAQFDRWVYASGKRLKGLIKRRAEEKELFLK